jgi:hypothetical protein
MMAADVHRLTQNPKFCVPYTADPMRPTTSAESAFRAVPGWISSHSP